jgi:hypothetical protein
MAPTSERAPVRKTCKAAKLHRSRRAVGAFNTSGSTDEMLRPCFLSSFIGSRVKYLDEKFKKK